MYMYQIDVNDSILKKNNIIEFHEEYVWRNEGTCATYNRLRGIITKQMY